MKKLFTFILCIVCCSLLTGCGGETKYFKNHPARALIEEGKVKVRYASTTEGTYFTSYSVYADLGKTDFEEIAEYDYLQITGKAFKDNGKSHNLSGFDGKFSFAFYENDSNEQLDAFMYKDGERLPPDEKDIFIPGTQFDRFKPDN